jgi:hypothetical protein
MLAEVWSTYRIMGPSTSSGVVIYQFYLLEPAPAMGKTAAAMEFLSR